MFQSITFNTVAGNVDKDDPLFYACNLPAFKARKGVFDFKPGLNIIVGPNGSGKSTVAQTLAMALSARQSGKSVLTQNSIRDLSFDNLGRVTDAFAIKHDAQPILFLNPRDTPGLNRGQFDNDFVSMGIESIRMKNLSTGENSEHRFREVMLTLMGELKFPDALEGKISEDSVNDLWADMIRKIRASFMTANIEKGQPTIIMDEPDTGLDARRAMTLWSVLTNPEVTSCFQIIVVSHSPMAMMAKNAHFIELEKGYVKDCQNLTSEIGKIDHFSKIKARAKANGKARSLTKAQKNLAQGVNSLTRNQYLALEHLKEQCGEWVSPTDVGREVGIILGKPDRHSSFGSPLCKKLVELGFAERHSDKGWYRTSKSGKGHVK